MGFSASGATSGAIAGAPFAGATFGLSVLAGAALGGLFGGKGKKPKVPKLPTLNPTQVQADAIAGNEANRPAAEALASKTNAFSLAELERAVNFAAPGSLDKARANISRQLSGELSPDVAQSVIRSSTAAGFSRGLGGSQIGRNLTLRDLGLTSLDQQNQGLSNFINLSTLLKPALMSSTSMFLSPEQRLAAAETQQARQYERDTIAAGVAAQASPEQSAMSGLLDSFASGALGAAGKNFGSGVGTQSTSKGPITPLPEPSSPGNWADIYGAANTPLTAARPFSVDSSLFLKGSGKMMGYQ